MIPLRTIRYNEYVEILSEVARRYNHTITDEHLNLLYSASIRDAPNILIALPITDTHTYPINRIIQLIRIAPLKMLIALDIFNTPKDLILWYVNIAVFKDIDFLYLTHSLLDIIFALYIFMLSPTELECESDTVADIKYIGDYTIFYDLSFNSLKRLISNLYATICHSEGGLYDNDHVLVSNATKIFNKAFTRYSLFGIKTESVYYICDGIHSPIVDFETLSNKKVNSAKRKNYLKYY